MRKLENFDGLAFFNNGIRFDFKSVFTSYFVRLAFAVTLMAMGLYAIQYLNLID